MGPQVESRDRVRESSLGSSPPEPEGPPPEGRPRKTQGRSGLTNGALQTATGAELGDGGSSDLDLRLRLRVDAFARFALLRVELSEAGELHRLARCQSFRDDVYESVHRSRGVFLAQVSLRREFLYEIRLGHRSLP